MRAVLCRSLDGPAALSVEEIAEPAVQPGEVIIAVRAAALNFFDTLVTRGRYQFKPELPFSPSGEVAGTISAVGPGVTGLSEGELAVAYLGWGGAREFVAVDAGRVVTIPAGVDVATAAGISITYGTALHGLRDRAGVRPGETVAVLGASGGAGLAAVEIAKLMGARVIAAASGPDKLAICRTAGADELVDYGTADLKSALRDLTGGRGVDVVYDCVGGPYCEPAVRATAWAGRYLVVGFAAGDIPKLPLNLLLLKGCAAIGVFWSEAVRRDPLQHRANVAQLLAWIAEGRLAPRIEATYPFARAAEALTVLDERRATGKIVLVPDQA
ncbi:MAG: NADPH:quinone oxidoreductase family protein [Hyphomicrobiaceae bacterium]|nr:NADPH:quinone oxidoreductase family protein [Hyphomicrobiaceae bacterium]